MPATTRATLALGVALAFSPAVALGQFPRHRLSTIYPVGGREGETVSVQITGAEIDGPVGLWFDHPGLRGFHVKGPKFVVAIAPGTPAGHHDVRVVGPLGVSNPRTFVVGDRTETIEVEPNNEPAKANALTLNSVANGRLDNSPDVDNFAFEGKAGQRVFAELCGERIETRIDGVLALLDPAGRKLAESHDGFGADPFLDISLPVDGRYVVQVRDVIYQGSPEYAYRLSLSDGPHLDAAIPASLMPGRPTEVTLLGRNIGGKPAPDAKVEGRTLERRRVTITAPLGDIDPRNPSDGLLAASPGTRRGFDYRLSTGAGLSNPLFFAESSDPIVLEKEPNDDAEHAQEINLPCDFSAAFAQPGDRDVYHFSARKGDVWIIEASAEQLGSQADPSLVLQQIVEKGEPKDLATADDQPDAIQGRPFSIASVDAHLRWQVPADGKYQILVNDLYSSQRGDVRHFYRLNIRPERPDFRLFAHAMDLAGGGSTTVRAGGRASLVVTAHRIDGFAGPIEISAVDLPAGVTSEPTLVGPGQFQASLVLTASPDAKSYDGPISIVGRAVSGDRKEVLDYLAGTSKVRPELERPALGGTVIWDAQNNQNVLPARVTRGNIVSVREGAPFQLVAHPSSWVVAPGETIELTVEAVRRTGFVDAISLSAAALPPNMNSGNASIAKDQTSASLKLTVPANVAAGNYTFLVRGTGVFPFSKDPKATTKPNINVNEPSNLIRLTVRRK